MRTLQTCSLMPDDFRFLTPKLSVPVQPIEGPDLRSLTSLEAQRHWPWIETTWTLGTSRVPDCIPKRCREKEEACEGTFSKNPRRSIQPVNAQIIGCLQRAFGSKPHFSQHTCEYDTSKSYEKPVDLNQVFLKLDDPRSRQSSTKMLGDKITHAPQKKNKNNHPGPCLSKPVDSRGMV